MQQLGGRSRGCEKWKDFLTKRVGQGSYQREKNGDYFGAGSPAPGGRWSPFALGRGRGGGGGNQVQKPPVPNP